jgi:uncharacterized protein (UPF0332 family)
MFDMSTSDEIKSMLEKSRRYLQSAEVLRLERDYDSAVSTIYLFSYAEAFLLAKRLRFSSHKGVISAFGPHFVKAKILPKEFHPWLREAFEKRQISDYTYTTPANDTHTLDLKKKAEQFLAKTEELLQKEGVL